MQQRPRRSYWNNQTNVFCFKKFIIAKLFRMQLTQLSTRMCPVSVHIAGSLPLVVPQPVLSFLGRGDKFVATQHVPAWSKIYEALDEFSTNIKRSVQLRNATERPDPLNGLRRRFFNQRSHWIPHCNDFPEVHSYLENRGRHLVIVLPVQTPLP